MSGAWERGRSGEQSWKGWVGVIDYHVPCVVRRVSEVGFRPRVWDFMLTVSCWVSGAGHLVLGCKRCWWMKLVPNSAHLEATALLGGRQDPAAERIERRDADNAGILETHNLLVLYIKRHFEPIDGLAVVIYLATLHGRVMLLTHVK